MRDAQSPARWPLTWKDLEGVQRLLEPTTIGHDTTTLPQRPSSTTACCRPNSTTFVLKLGYLWQSLYHHSCKANQGCHWKLRLRKDGCMIHNLDSWLIPHFATMQILPVFRVYHYPAKPGYTEGLEQLPDDMRQPAIEKGLSGPWKSCRMFHGGTGHKELICITLLLGLTHGEASEQRLRRRPATSTLHQKYDVEKRSCKSKWDCPVEWTHP